MLRVVALFANLSLFFFRCNRDFDKFGECVEGQSGEMCQKKIDAFGESQIKGDRFFLSFFVSFFLSVSHSFLATTSSASPS